MADIAFKSSNRREQVTATGTPALLVLPEGEDAHRVYYDDQQRGPMELVRMGAIVIGMLRDMGLLKEAMRASHASPDSAEFRIGGRTIKPEDLPPARPTEETNAR